MNGRTRFRLFLSSPGDVRPERDAVERVVSRINAEHAEGGAFELLRWEDIYYTAGSSFQQQIPPPSQSDIVVCIFWKQLGTELPEAYRRGDGTLPTGTEYEFEEALSSAVTSPNRLPDVLVYRKMAEVLFREETVAIEREQRERFLAFWRRWFHSEKGHFVAGFHTFPDTPAFESLIEQHLRLWLRRRSGHVTWPFGSPYIGLAPFEVKHAPVFFGRGREIERVRARLIANMLTGDRALLVIGASGSGKSSLVRAGLIPRIAETGGLSGLVDRTRWAIVTPAGLAGSIPRAWAQRFAEALFAPDVLGAELRNGDYAEAEPLARLLLRSPEDAAQPLLKALERVSAAYNGGLGTALVLVVDQLEELFTWPKSEATAFTQLLARLISHRRNGQCIVLVGIMRSDFRARLGEIPDLETMLRPREVAGPGESERIIEIGLPSQADLREMIAGPARAAGLAFEHSADNQRDLAAILEATAQPDALPALQYLLSELYRHREGNVLTLAAYDTLGGVAGVMATRGEAVVAALDAAAQATFPRVARALVQRLSIEAPATARLVPEATFPDGTSEGRLVNALKEANLLTSDRGMVRIAHESLISGWDRLRHLIERDRRLLDARHHLSQLYERYRQETTVRRSRMLLQGFPLEEGRELMRQWGASALADAAPGLPAFIAASDVADRRRRLGRTLVALTVVATLLAGAFGVWHFRMEAATWELETQLRLTLSRVEAARRLQDWETATKYAVDALALKESAETRSALVESLMATSPHAILRTLTKAELIAWAGRSQLVASRFNGDGLIVQAANDGCKLAPWKLTGIDNPDLFALAASPSGRVLALLADGSVAITSSSGATSSLQPLRLKSDVSLRLSRHASIGWRKDTAIIALVTFDAEVLIRECAADGAGLCTDRPPPKPVKATLPAADVVALSGDGAFLAIGSSQSSRVSIVRLESDVEPGWASIDIGAGSSVTSLALSSQGALLAVGTAGGSLLLYGSSSAGWHEIARLPSGSGPIGPVAWSPVERGATTDLAYRCDNANLCISAVSAKGPGPEVRLTGHRDALIALSWAPDGDLLASMTDTEVRVWQRKALGTPLTVVRRTPAGKRLEALAADLQRGLLVAGDSDGLLWVWRDDTDAAPLRIEPIGEIQGAIASIAISAEGRIAAAHRNGGVAVWPPVGLSAPKDPVATVALAGGALRLAWTQAGHTLVVPSGRQLLLVEGTAIKHIPGPPGMVGLPDGVGTTPSGGILVSYSGGLGILEWDIKQAKFRTVLDAAAIADSLSALSMSVHPSGRWLAATRGDSQIKIYDLGHTSRATTLALYHPNSRTVAFSPDGKLLAALGADSRLYVWRWDSATGSATLSFAVPAWPSVTASGRRESLDRSADWIAWLDNRRIAISGIAGEVLALDTDIEQFRKRAGRLASSAFR
jgi:WD40 repeat protein